VGLDSLIYAALALATALAIVLGAILVLARFLERRRPGLTLAPPLMTAAGLRIIASIGISAIPAERTLRGGDESFWLELASGASNTPIGSATSLDLLATELHAWVFSTQLRLLDAPPELALRFVQIGIAVGGIALLAAAVNDLAGPRAALAGAWLLAFEPSSIFFSSILHKEPLLMLATGLVALGGARLWTRGELSALIPMAVGCLMAVATREYLGWFLIAGAAATVLHGSVRHARTRGRSLALAAMVVVGMAAASPVVWDASEEDALPAQLQVSQNFNTADTAANLSLEQVDYSTRTAIITNLPVRIRDVLLRPYPWQLANLSQQLGVLGGLVMLSALFALARYGWRSRGEILARAGPLVYLGIATLVAYSLSAGNAGTAFRYRTHILALVIAAAVVLREHVREKQATGAVIDSAAPASGRVATA